MPKKTVPAIRSQKNAHKLVCLTAYTAPMAQQLDDFVDILLVGDSLGMVIYGYPSTLQVDMETMIRHGKAVAGHTKQALVVVDLPFGSYQESKEQAFRNAARLMSETACDAVKLEGGAEMAETITYLTQRGIPVMAHIGLQPQSVQTLGGYQARGRNAEECARLMDDAYQVEQAGAFAVVIEAVAEELAREITGALKIPTIGIGASAACDGQILVTEDMLGLTTGKKPRFVRNFVNLAVQIDIAANAYREAVQDGSFPDQGEIYAMRPKKLA